MTFVNFRFLYSTLGIIILELSLAVIYIWTPFVEGAIIPPSWANTTLNPCAKESWQRLYWPKDGRCYNIFTQGPCGDTQEFYFDKKTLLSSCRCSRGFIWHEGTDRCYELYTKGPCRQREYFAMDSVNQFGSCHPYEECDSGKLFWPKSKKCYGNMTRGPCSHGYLLYDNPESGSVMCGCKQSLMPYNHWAYGPSCHELLTRGPCMDGHVFIFDLREERTMCACSEKMAENYHWESGRCYPVGQKGPCSNGQIFSYDKASKKSQCSCLPDFVLWAPLGHCFRAYTRGPCPSGFFLKPGINESTCEMQTCVSGHLLDHNTDICYPVGRRGPCPKGKLWVFERATSIRGQCHCDSQLLGYWEPHGVCYELGDKGPCPKKKVLSYNRSTGSLVCRCDPRRGYVSWTNGKCLKSGVRMGLDKLIPISGPKRVLSGNDIMSERVHRGLTLPNLTNGFVNGSLPVKISKKFPNLGIEQQKSILEDIQQLIRNISCSGNISARSAFPFIPKCDRNATSSRKNSRISRTDKGMFTLADILRRNSKSFVSRELPNARLNLRKEHVAIGDSERTIA